MRLRFTRQALRNIHEIADYLRPRSPAGLQHVNEALTGGFALIGDYPNVGRAYKRGLRRLAVARYPYAIYYRVLEKAAMVEVVAIRHAARSSDFGS